MLFFMLAFGIFAIEFYKNSFRRRCVWEDTQELKLPVQWCKTYDQTSIDIAAGKTGEGWFSNCGALQRCIDHGNPFYGFVSFDNLPSTVVALFQSMSLDGQYDVMWPALEVWSCEAILLSWAHIFLW